MTDNYKLYPQVRISRKALEHLRELLPHYRSERGYNVPMTAIASEIILSIPLPIQKNGKKPAGNPKTDNPK